MTDLVADRHDERVGTEPVDGPGRSSAPRRRGRVAGPPWRFAFRLGEIGVGSVVPAVAGPLRTHFIRLIGGGAEPALPFDRFPDGTDVAIAHSYPTPRGSPASVLPGSIRYVPAQYPHHYIDLSGSYRVVPRQVLVEVALDAPQEDRAGSPSSPAARSPGASSGPRRWASSTGSPPRSRKDLPVAAPRFGSARPRPVPRGPVPVRRRRGGTSCFTRASRSRSSSARAGGHLLYESVGYDPDFQRWSPGTVLASPGAGVAVRGGPVPDLRFHRGGRRPQAFFANRSVLCADLFYFRKGLRNVLIRGPPRRASTASRAGRSACSIGSGSGAGLKKMIRSKA